MASPSGNPNPAPERPVRARHALPATGKPLITPPLPRPPPASSPALPPHRRPPGPTPTRRPPRPSTAALTSTTPTIPPVSTTPLRPLSPTLTPPRTPCPNSGGPNPGARLMQLLGNTAPSHLESAASMPPASEPAAPLPTTSSAPPARIPSSKMPRGRLLGAGERAVHDVDSRLPGEAEPPQLEVTPITKYTSDPGLVLGRQIAVNRTYIVYGLKLGNIRVLNINTALRSLLRGHTQKVTDMAFFAEDVHRLASASADGQIYVWKIDEGPDEESKSQITGKIEIAIQIIGDAETYHPRICWHSHKQEILYVGIGNYILRIDIPKVGGGRDFSTEEPLKCPLDKLIDGVKAIGKHDADVTDLSISQWMTTRLASASKDGTVKIWDDRRAVPLSVLKPHNDQAVYSVSFLTAPERPNHINLVTAGCLNREVKIWASTNEDGWLLSSDSETWKCMQTLELVSSLECRPEEAFFNQVAVLPQASLILIANAKKNAIYAVHVEYGPDPASTRLDYIADFTVTMPILSLTGTHEAQTDGEQVVQVYCVQTMAIQQYGLELSLCVPPTADNTGSGRDPALSHVYERSSETVAVDSSTGGTPVGFSAVSSTKPSSDTQGTEVGSSHIPSVAPALKMNLAGYPLVLSRGPSGGSSHSDRDADQSSIGRRDSFGREESKGGRSDGVDAFAEMASSGSSSSQNVASTADAKHMDEAKSNQIVELEAVKETQVLPKDRPGKHAEQTDKYSVDDSQADRPVPLKQPSESLDENVLEGETEAPEQIDGPCASRDLHIRSATKEEKVMHTQVSGQYSPSTSTFNSTDSSHEPRSNTNRPSEPSLQAAAIQGTLQQLISMYSNLQKQLNTIVSAPIAKEGKRIEASLGRNMEKSVKANVDAMWARFQDENTRHEKTERDRMQQMANLVSASVNKDIPVMLEKPLKKEISSLGPAVARTTAPFIEKCMSSAVSDSLQKVLGDKVVNQLDKSISSKLEANVAKQIQTQFQTSTKQTLQDAFCSSFESSIIPSFEQSCKTIFEQIDGAFQKGMSEHSTAIQQQVVAGHTPLAQTLRETITSASSITHGLTSELLDGQRKLLSLVTSGSPTPHSTGALQPTNGPVANLPEVDAPLDPVKELGKLITEQKFDEAFTLALQRSDVSIVSWLCSQVNLQALCRAVPIPLNQGVLLALFQQLACDISNDTSRKLQWMTHVAVAINPTDPIITMHVRPIFEQVYGVLVRQRSLPTTSASDEQNIRLILHVITAVLMSQK
ncbi:hypothetical protein PR202_ga17112 [Eleusine coracana subsp. coracana]|uniref:Enhancer of mRNA-decapping protein 4 WD40 repeat region domain-containing protein n=1 Tax=Eleusine coracana subsp. coracana TaxID=191504 RepID=A0AAV5CP52_ELECO|nr:hypothetical protein PR202_ga17112 [Eleusine coracana subsp. coracana]